MIRMKSATQTLITCPLCKSSFFKHSWLGKAFFQGHDFDFLCCSSCKSLYCSPMPDDELLSIMYSSDYQTQWDGSVVIEDPKEPERVANILRGLSKGTFVDYGCGKGQLLSEAAKLKWQAIGVEFDPNVVEQLQSHTGLKIYCADSGTPERPIADVLHLGDVIEHLTRLDEQMPQILRWLKPGGILLAQGPLEAHRNLFTWVISLARRLRPTLIEGPPYHVILATSHGQRTFFTRFHLQEIEYRMSEVSWPAPVSLHGKDWRNARTVGLFFLRKVSQAVSFFLPRLMGNRYFYQGRL